MDKFLEYLKLNYNSLKTIKSYYQQVNTFNNYCNGDINQENLNNYLLKWKEEGKSNATFNAFKIAMIAYSKFTGQEFEFPKWKKTQRQKIEYYFTEKQLPTLLKYFYREKDLVLRFMFYTGARPSEVINLKVSDINFETKDIVFYNAKGNKDRVVPILNDQLCEDLQTHCEKKSDKVFPFSYQQIQMMFKKIQKQMNLTNEVIEPRTMRRSFAKYCLSKGMDISYLQKVMGHTDIKTTEIYAEPDKKMIKEFCEKIRNEK